MTNKFGVDRAKFLAVATALASLASFQACVTTNEKDDAKNNEAGAGMDGGGTTGQAGSSSNAAGDDTGAGQGGALGGSGSGGGGADGGATDGGASPGGAAQGGASEGGGAGAGTCDDSVGQATCAGLTAECTPYCNAALANLKPAVAAAAVACLEGDQTGNCDGGYGCLADATAEGCAEDVATICESAVQVCSDQEPTKPSCQQLLSGFTEAARTEVMSCIDEGCFSVYSCAEGFFFASATE